MAAQSNASLPGGDTTKIVLAAVLIAVFAGIWAPRLLKRRRSSQPAPSAKAQPSTATVAPTPGDSAMPAPTTAAAGSRVASVVATAFAQAGNPPEELKRDPFAVSEALRQLMTDAKPREDVVAQSAPQAAAPEAADPLREARLWTLQATVIDGAIRYGMIDGKIAVQGQTFRGMTVKSIGEREVVLESPAGKLLLSMDKGDAK